MKKLFSNIWQKYGKSHDDMAHGCGFALFFLYHTPCCMEWSKTDKFFG